MDNVAIGDAITASFNRRIKSQLVQFISPSCPEKASKAGIGIVAMKTQAGVYWDEEKQNKINMKAALKWALQSPHVHTSIPGFATFDQLNEDLEVMSDITLTDKDKKDLR